MPSAIDVFREQREAAEQLHGRVQEISALLDHVRQQVNALALNEDLRSMPAARATRGGRSRTLLNSRPFGRELNSLISLSTECSR